MPSDNPTQPVSKGSGLGQGPAKITSESDIGIMLPGFSWIQNYPQPRLTPQPTAWHTAFFRPSPISLHSRWNRTPSTV